MLTQDDVELVLRRIHFPGWTFHVRGSFDADAPQPCCLYATFMAADNDAPGQLTEQTTRKWLLSRHMVVSEIVQTAFKCVLTANEHEAREQFLYRGERVFGPHFDVEALAYLARSGKLEVRQ